MENVFTIWIFTSSKPYSNFDVNHMSFGRGCTNGTRHSRLFLLGSFAYHLYKPWINWISHVNGKQPILSLSLVSVCLL